MTDSLLEKQRELIILIMITIVLIMNICINISVMKGV